MKFLESYPYASIGGLFKVGVEYEDDSDYLSIIQIAANEIVINLNIDVNFAKNNKKVFFGINIYKFIINNNGNISFKLLKNSKVVDEYFYKYDIDEKIFNYISEDMKSLPATLPLPIESKLFSNLKSNEYPIIDNDMKVNGFKVFKKLIDPNLVKRANQEIDHYCASGWQGYEDGSSQRIKLLHLEGGAISELFTYQKIYDSLAAIYGVEMRATQSLCYRYGSQQSIHSDYVHLTAYPENLMCGVWVALEDVQMGAGELVYYPGSHLSKRLTMSDFNLGKITNDDYSSFDNSFGADWKKQASLYQPFSAYLKAGDVLVWDGNLLHAGAARKVANLTRKSVVFHYFGKGAVSYYDSTGDIGISTDIRI